LVVLRDDQLVAMLDKIQRKSALYQIGGPGLGAPRKRVAIALTIITLDHPQLVEILRLWQKERFEITFVCSVDSSSFLPFECIGHLRRTDTSDDEGMAD